MRFDDKVVIVTGAAGGIGLATARRFGREGARVVLADHDAAKADAAAAAMRADGAPDALAFRCDVASDSDVERTVDAAIARFGRLDVVVNNAGVMIFKPIEAHSEADLLHVLQVDFLGAFRFVRQAFLQMPTGRVDRQCRQHPRDRDDAAGLGLCRGEGGAAVVDALGGDRGPAEGHPRQCGAAGCDRDADAARQPERAVGRRSARPGRHRAVPTTSLRRSRFSPRTMRRS